MYTTFLRVLIVGLAFVVAGCSSNGLSSPTASSSITGSARSYNPFRAVQTGVAPQFLQLLRLGSSGVRTKSSPLIKIPKYLGVSDFGLNEVVVLDRAYQPIFSYKNINIPDGDWYGWPRDPYSFYVADAGAIDVQQFEPGNTSPTFTYSTGLVDPVDVTADFEGNVLVADYADGGSGFINEYVQGSNSVEFQCSPGGAVEGIAADKYGDVFASYNSSSSGQGKIVEYKGGLMGCNGTVLPITLTFAGGLQLDKKGRLVACDQLVGVDIIPRPYNKISSTITGFADPFHDALNKQSNLLFVADPANADVAVLSYPSGALLETLGSGNGLSDPSGVATYPYNPY